MKELGKIWLETEKAAGETEPQCQVREGSGKKQEEAG